MNYQITATLGPSSPGPALWHGLLNAGCTAFRINTSHVSVAKLTEWVDQLNDFFLERKGCPVIFDLQGSKWRLGRFSSFVLQKGASVELIYGENCEQPGRLPIPHFDFFRAVIETGEEILIHDAKIRVAVVRAESEYVLGRVIQGGEVSARKGVTVPGSTLRSEQLQPRDAEIIHLTSTLSQSAYAVSFVKDGREMANYRTLLGPELYLIAKLERQTALEDVNAIAAWVDELWLCRGDLGAELGLSAMAQAVADLSLSVKSLPKPVHMAGQVLEHMTTHPEPTRAEICHLYDLIRSGYQGVILSDETAIGQYPLESCKAAALFRKG